MGRNVRCFLNNEGLPCILNVNQTVFSCARCWKTSGCFFCCQSSLWRGQACFLKPLSESLSFGNSSPLPCLLHASPTRCLRRWRLLISQEHALSPPPVVSCTPDPFTEEQRSERFDGCESLQMHIDLFFLHEHPQFMLSYPWVPPL